MYWRGSQDSRPPRYSPEVKRRSLGASFSRRTIVTPRPVLQHLLRPHGASVLGSPGEMEPENDRTHFPGYWTESARRRSPRRTTPMYSVVQCAKRCVPTWEDARVHSAHGHMTVNQGVVSSSLTPGARGRGSGRVRVDRQPSPVVGRAAGEPLVHSRDVGSAAAGQPDAETGLRGVAVVLTMTELLAGCGTSAGPPPTTAGPHTTTSTKCPPEPGARGAPASGAIKQCGTNGGGAGSQPGR